MARRRGRRLTADRCPASGQAVGRRGPSQSRSNFAHTNLPGRALVPAPVGREGSTRSSAARRDSAVAGACSLVGGRLLPSVTRQVSTRPLCSSSSRIAVSAGGSRARVQQRVRDQLGDDDVEVVRERVESPGDQGGPGEAAGGAGRPRDRRQVGPGRPGRLGGVAGVSVGGGDDGHGGVRGVGADAAGLVPGEDVEPAGKPAPEAGRIRRGRAACRAGPRRTVSLRADDQYCEVCHASCFGSSPRGPSVRGCVGVLHDRAR